MSPLEPPSGENCSDSPLREGGREDPARANGSLIWVSVALLGSFLYAYWGTISALVNTWWNVRAYHHGFLIPAIALYLVWNHRSRIRGAAVAPQYLTGSFLCLLSFLLLFVGHAAAFLTLQYIALPMTLAGAVLLVFGKHVFRFAGPPIGYLTLMLPVWDILMDRIRHPSQLISAHLGALLLRALGTPAQRDGVQIVLPSVVVEVTPDCSGLNYMLAFIAVGVPLGIVFLNGRLGRFLLISGALVLAFLSNILRIALVGLLAGDSGDAPYHDVSGLFVAAVGFLVLFVGALVASRGRPASSRTETVAGGQGASAEGCSFSAFVRTRSFRRLGLLMSLGLVFEGVLLDVHREKSVPLERDFSGFPLELGAWKARPGDNPVAADLALEADQSLHRVYERASGPAIGLYLGYLEKQEQGRELVDYRTDEHFRAAAPVTLELRAGGALQANSLVTPEGDVEKLRLFWWELDGRSMSSPYRVKFFAVYDSLIRGRSNGALVVLETDIGSEEGDASRALAALAEFVHELLPAIKSSLQPGSPPSP